MIKLYAYNTINSLKILMFLLETDLEYEFIPINIRAGEQHTPEFRKVNPASKVPVLIDGERLLTESNSILLYLAKKTGWGLAATPEQQEELIAWLFYQASTQGPYFGQIEFWSHIAKKPNPEALAQYHSIANRTITYLDGELEGKAYFCGDEFSIADISLFPWFNNHEHLGLSLAHAKNLSSWIERVKDRPSTSKACAFFETSEIFQKKNN